MTLRNRTYAALVAVFAIAFRIGESRAESYCQTEKPPNDRQFHCIEMGSKRFRIPDGHLAFWQYPNFKTGRIERFDTMADEVRGKFTNFYFVSDLPDLTPLDIKKIFGGEEKEDLRRRVTSMVMTQANVGFPLSIDFRDGQYVFSDRLVEHLVSVGYEEYAPGLWKKGESRFWLIRSAIGITQIESDSQGWGLMCLHPYSTDIILGTVVADDERTNACFHGRRVVEKLRSFEY